MTKVSENKLNDAEREEQVRNTKQNWINKKKGCLKNLKHTKNLRTCLHSLTTSF